MNYTLLKKIKWSFKSFHTFRNENGPLSEYNGIYSLNDSLLLENNKKSYLTKSKEKDPDKGRTLSKLRDIKIGDSVGIINISCPTNPFIEAIGTCLTITETSDLFNDEFIYVYTINVLSSVSKRFSLCGKKVLPMREIDRREVGTNVEIHSPYVVKCKKGFKANIVKKKTQTNISKYFFKGVHNK